MASAETMWVRPVSGRASYYQVLNIPLDAYGLAFEDIVECTQGEDGRKYFVRVIEPSGLLTVRLAGPEADAGRFAELADLLRTHSVSGGEKFTDRYIGYAMERTAFDAIEMQIDELCDDETLFVEIANDAQGDDADIAAGRTVREPEN